MKWTIGKNATWLIAVIALASVFIASPSRAGASRAFATAQDLPEGDGKKILQASCTACHGLDDVVNSHMDKKGWEDLIQSMISNGAAVDDKDFPVLVAYLVKNFGPSGSQAGQPAQGGGASGDGKNIL